MGTAGLESADTQTKVNGRTGTNMDLATAVRQARAKFEQGQLDEAAKIAVAILKFRPGQPAGVQVLAGVAERRGQIERAVQILEASLTGRRTDSLSQANLCRLYRAQNRLAYSIKAGQTALEYGNTEVLTDLGDSFVRMGRTDEALACFEKAVAFDPMLPRAHLSLAHALLMKGDFRTGWAEYEWRYRLKSTANLLPKFKQPAWNGMALKNSAVLVVCEQGFGDCFQFARYLPLVRQRVKTMYVGASPDLYPLMARLCGPDITFDRWENIPPFAFQIPLSSLPYMFGTTLETIPQAVPYLRADDAKTAIWRHRLSQFAQGRPTVGIVWHGRPSSAINSARSVPLGLLTRLLERDDLAIVSLQVGAGSEQLQQHPARSRVFNAADFIKDFDDTAAAMTALDRIVTIETASAHLAGALGRPALVMLPEVADWRWMEGRSDSPWYPSIELIRPIAGDAPQASQWDSVVTQVLDRLNTL